MTLHSTRLAIALATTLATLAAAAPDAHAKGNPHQDAQTSLVRPDGSPDADAKGTLRVREHAKQSRERFEVKAKKVDAGQLHDLFLETGVGTDVYEFVASLEGDDDASGDELKFKVDTKHGDALPGGAADLSELAGRHVEIRLGIDVVLHGVVPAFGASKKPVKTKLKLLPPQADPPAPDMKGRVTTRSKADKGQERIVVRVKAVPSDPSAFHVFIETGVGTDIFEDVGAIVATGATKGRYRRRSNHGEMLPFDVGSVADLAGRGIQVRAGGDLSDAIHLEGTLPAID